MSTNKDYILTAVGVDNVELREEPRALDALQPDEVAGSTVCSLMSNGTELNVVKGHYQGQAMRLGQFPVQLGYAAVFEVDAVGQAVTDVKPGECVFSMGRHRRYQRLKRREVLPLPGNLSPEAATFARLMNIAMSAVTTTNARPPCRAVVTGLGPIGLLSAMVLVRCGYEVLACDPDGQRCNLARSVGLRNVYPGIPSEDPALRGSAALLVECSAHEQAVLDGMLLLAPKGEVVLVGVPLVRTSDLTAQELMNRLFRQDLRMRSGTEWEVPVFSDTPCVNSMMGQMRAALDWLAAGSIVVDGLYEVRSPREAGRLYEAMAQGQLSKLCIILDWRTL